MTANSDNITQPTYQATLDPGRRGLVVGSDFNADTGNCETAAGLAFGIAVSQGSVSDKGVIIGGTSEGFRGITIRDVTLESANLDKYPRYSNVGVLTRGKIWCLPSHAVAPGDQVYFVPGTGVLTNQSSGNEVINGARWVTTAVADALAVVELSGFQHSS